MATLWQDLHYGVRMLLRNPAFAFVAVMTLALGIGANTAIFSVVNAVILRPLPYESPEQLVRVGGANLRTGRAMGSFSPQDFYDWRERNTVFEQVAAYDGWSPGLTGTNEPERIEAARVSASFFSILRAKPEIGRAFLPGEDQPGNNMVVVLGHSLWKRRFGADPGIINSQVTLNGASYTIVGVMPASFETPRFTRSILAEPELWAPFAPNLNDWTRGGRAVDAAIARLKPGVTLEQADAELKAIARQLEQQYPDTNAGQSVSVASLHESLVGKSRTALLVLLVAVGFVLLIACANVANLLLARAAARQKEIAIRTALGAGRLRIIRQLLTESVLLAGLGGALGLLSALWTTDLLIAGAADALPRLNGTVVDAHVLGFTLLVSLLTGIAFGIAPALQASRPDLNEMLKEGGRTSALGGARARVRSLLIVAEVAVSLVLLIGAGLLIRSFLRLQEVRPGFNPEHVLALEMFLPGIKYPEDHQHIAFYEEVLRRTRALAGVEAAGVVSVLPVSDNYDRIGFSVEGEPPPPPGEGPDADRYMISSGYFQALAIPLQSGRQFNEDDGRADAQPVVIINETLARRYWQTSALALGKRVRVGDERRPWRTVVGIVGDVKQYGLDTPSTMQVYLPHQQSPSQQMTLVVRAGGDPASQTAAVRNEIWAVDKDQPVYNIRTMEQVLAKSIAGRRFNMLLLGIFAGVALLLAAVGIYGVISYSVTQRTHEIGIRMALGAQGSDVLKMVVGQGMVLALIGVGIGMIASFALTRVISSLLFGVSATDPFTFGGIALLLTVVAFLACFIPARKAAKVDPMVALRYE
ncbi:MAG TPA: ABC transporter permease [Pyrinomonadaceae bacterium]|jgi:putative ABC transport system permease protein